VSAAVVGWLIGVTLGAVAVAISILQRRRYALRITRRWVAALRAGDVGTARALEVSAAAHGVDVRAEL